MRLFVVMGVSGSGKTSVGQALAEEIGAGYIDGDKLHSAASIAKMERGEPLNDDDRRPWLERVGATLEAAEGPCIVGCSALKRAYRDIIRRAAGAPVLFLFLDGGRRVLEARMSRRTGHFMPVSLLDSQLATLERPEADEAFVRVDIDQPLEDVVSSLAAQIERLERIG